MLSARTHLAPSGCLCLALFVARLLVMLVLSGFLEDASLLQRLLESLQCAIERFIRSNLNLCQSYPSSTNAHGQLARSVGRGNRQKL